MDDPEWMGWWENGQRPVFWLAFWERPWTTNAERAKNRFVRQANTKRWREFSRKFAVEAGPRQLTDATVDVFLHLKGRLQDTAACNPAVKAVIDGLVDARLFDDDTGVHVKAIRFHAPQRATENVLVVRVEGRLVDAVGD